MTDNTTAETSREQYTQQLMDTLNSLTQDSRLDLLQFMALLIEDVDKAKEYAYQRHGYVFKE